VSAPVEGIEPGPWIAAGGIAREDGVLAAFISARSLDAPVIRTSLLVRWHVAGGSPRGWVCRAFAVEKDVFAPDRGGKDPCGLRSLDPLTASRWGTDGATFPYGRRTAGNRILSTRKHPSGACPSESVKPADPKASNPSYSRVSRLAGSRGTPWDSQHLKPSPKATQQSMATSAVSIGITCANLPPR